MSITIYTDGSCMPNPGRGGWAYIAIEDDSETHVKSETHVYGGDNKSTNNKMELTAVIQALSDFKKYKKLTIYSDSQYVIKCATGVWKKSKNLELWEEYEKVSKGKDITFVWVKGHNGDKYNEMVDKLAKKGIFE